MIMKGLAAIWAGRADALGPASFRLRPPSLALIFIVRLQLQ